MQGKYIYKFTKFDSRISHIEYRNQGNFKQNPIFKQTKREVKDKRITLTWIQTHTRTQISMYVYQIEIEREKRNRKRMYDHMSYGMKKRKR